MIRRLMFGIMAPIIAGVMESPQRRRFQDPVRMLKAAGVTPGREVLEVGCGTGFFTIPAAGLVGDEGRVHSIDVYPPAIERVAGKVQDAGLTNVLLTEADATDTDLPGESFDLVLLFGVLPSPTLPTGKLLPEMHRLLKSGGALAVWTAFPWWSPASVTKNGLFTYAGKEQGVHTFRRA